MPKPNEHRWAIDGIEEGVARVEVDGARMLTVPSAILPAAAREGQLLLVVRSESGGAVTLTITIDEQATAEALARSEATTRTAMAKSKKRDPGGDVAL